MPLQNRIDPFGRIQAVSARGGFTGNRGIIHDPETKTLLRQRWSTKAWIICDLVHPRGRIRQVFGRNGPSGGAGWTELFFLDEVTALAAGHRPCFYCRREAAKRYTDAFAAAFGLHSPRVTEIDARLHAERLACGVPPVSLTDGEIRSLPDGAMIAFGAKSFAVRDGALLAWSFSGYGDARISCRSLPPGGSLITPPATVAALRAGYRPAWHSTAGGRPLRR